MSDRIVILTEAGFNKGFGHFYRMSTICDAAEEANISFKMIIDGDESAENNLVGRNIVFEKWQSDYFDVSSLITKNDIVVVDSYNVDLSRLEYIARSCAEMIVIDDTIRLDYHDMNILNPNFYAESLNYPDNKGNSYFIGKDYTLLRKSFVIRNDRKVSSKVHNILITMGGTDVKCKTAHFMEAAKKVSKDVKLSVVITSAYKNKESIKTVLDDADMVFVDVPQNEMSALMNKCDFAISAAGGTSNELIKMQCPALVYIVAENQRLNADYLAEAGCVDIISDSDDIVEVIRKMFDQKERERLVDNMKRYASDKNAADFIIGKVEEKKCEPRL